MISKDIWLSYTGGRAKKKPPTEHNAEPLKQAKQLLRDHERDQIAIEGKFGQGKRRFGLARIMAKLAVNSEVMIMVSFLVMNRETLLSRVLYFWLSLCRTWLNIPLRITPAMAAGITDHILGWDELLAM